MFSEHMQHYKHTVAILPIFETGPFLGVRDPTPLHQSMRRRQRLNVTVQKYAPNWYAIFKSAHDLELAHDVGPAHDVSPTYISILRFVTRIAYLDKRPNVRKETAILISLLNFKNKEPFCFK